ncbi:MAG: lysophospholipid acyltransferase family protein [Candidatus Tectimicrobiota bacterium]
MQIGHKIFQAWRICATGMAFSTFMLCSLVLSITVFPLIQLLPIAQEKKTNHILQWVHWSCKLFIKYMLCLKIMGSFEVQGLEDVYPHKGCIFIANHPTLIDVVAIMSCVPRCNCIVKASLWEHAYIGSVVRAAQYIPNKHAAQIIADCQQSFQAGRSLIIFPEGTRSPASGLRPFNRGAAQIALRTEVPIVLISITCDPPTLLKGQAWYEVPARPFRLRLCFHPLDTLPQAVRDNPSFPLKVRAFNAYLEEFFGTTTHMTSMPWRSL